jgi:general secretion pathway protein K
MATKKISSGGIALLMVLWAITLLMVIVFSFSALCRTETFAALGFREMVEKKNLAEAGIERALIEILFRNQKSQADLAEAWRTDGTPYIVEIGNSHCSVRITGESGKIDINMLTDASGIILHNLLVMRGATSEEADTIVDSLLDWRDSGDSDAHRLHGVETDYYQSLPIPYAAKNDNFDTVEELLLVKGMTQEILFGSGERKGVFDLLTVHAGTEKININAAPVEVLAAIPGIGREYAELIVSERRNRGSYTMADLQGIIGQGYTAASLFLAATEIQTYTIDSFGYKESGKAGFAVKATVTFADNNRYRYLYYKSPVRAVQ